jgi:creatinine amidohydrolase/Fe(II)-dependent formamide hydrolase-like protein
VHPDTGSGDPAAATAGKGREYFAAVTTAIAAVLVELSAATRGDLPYV